MILLVIKLREKKGNVPDAGKVYSWPNIKIDLRAENAVIPNFKRINLKNQNLDSKSNKLVNIIEFAITRIFNSIFVSLRLSGHQILYWKKLQWVALCSF